MPSLDGTGDPTHKYLGRLEVDGRKIRGIVHFETLEPCWTKKKWVISWDFIGFHQQKMWFHGVLMEFNQQQHVISQDFNGI